MNAARLVIVCSLAFGGCPLFGGAAGDPCDVDRFACEDGEFALDPSCTLDGALEVALGQGVEAYAPLHTSESPVVHTGPQGGQHLALGVRVANPELSRYDRVRVTFALYPEDACAPADEPPMPCAGATLGSRVAVPGSHLPLTVEDGAIEEYGMILVLAGAWQQPLVLDAFVEDPCGRTGRAQHRFVGVE
jgi:hypothetical protein